MGGFGGGDFGGDSAQIDTVEEVPPKKPKPGEEE
jgi:hypothetical protein